MNIQPTTSYNVSMNGRPNGNLGGVRKLWNKFGQKVLDIFPEKTFKESDKLVEKYKNYDTFMSKPAENRLIMGATAIVTQPVIDYYNHRVDEETRTVSRNRTIAKIVAGTAVGALVRGLCYNLTEKMTDVKGKTKFSKSLLPPMYYKELIRNPKRLKNYRSAVSTICALMIMSITNFALDAPLTAYLTNRLNSKTNAINTNSKLKEEGGTYV